MKNRTLNEILNYLKKELSSKESIKFLAPNPDSKNGAISLKSWVDIAEILKCKMLIPKLQGEFIEICLVKLKESSFHGAKVEDIEEKYGVESEFFKIEKLQLPYFVNAYKQALNLAKIETRQCVLNLGINRGDEFLFIRELLGKESFGKIDLTGIDHSKSAIEYAKRALPNCNFYAYDINKIDDLNLPKQDLIISIGTLQSPSIEYKPFLMKLTQEYLNPNGAIILGFPNCRWVGSVPIYGAKIKNYCFSEMGLLINDIIFAKKYLQQKKFKVFVSGREYLFLTAIREVN